MRLPLSLAISPPLKGPLLAFDHGSGELVLVELQGHLELSLDGVESEHPAADSASNGIKAGQKVGKLDLSVPSRPTLLIGHHRLVGKLVTLNAPMAILKHSLPVRAPALSSAVSDMLPPATSSPIKPTDLHRDNNGKRVRSSSSPFNAAISDHIDDRDEPANKKKATTTASSLATPNLQRHHQQAHDGTSPLAAALDHAGLTTPRAASLLPQTPLNVSELKRGSHEIVGIVKQKIVFSKRPEPVVNLEKEIESADEAV